MPQIFCFLCYLIYLTQFNFLFFLFLWFSFLLCVAFNNFYTIPIFTENAKLKLALAIPTGARITVGNDPMEMPPLVADKIIKDLSK